VGSETAIYLIYFLIYLFLIIGVGIYHGRKIQNIEGYLVAGRNQGFWSIFSSMVATLLGASLFIGFVGLGYSSGITGLFFWIIPSGLVSLIFIFVFGHIIRRTGLYTIPDVFTLRFGKNAALAISIVQMIIKIPLAAIKLIAIGVLFSAFFGMSLNVGIIIGFFIIAIYVYLGGLKAVIGTDKFQLLIVLFGLLLLFGFSFNHAGGLETVTGTIPADYWNPLGKSSLANYLLLTLSIAPYALVTQHHWQRVFASRDEAVARKGFTWSVIVVTAVYLITFLLGMILRSFLPAGLNPDMVFAEAIKILFTPLLAGIVLMGVMAAIMSSADTSLISGAATAARNIYRQHFRPQATEEHMLKASRFSVLILAGLGLMFAIFGGGIIPTAILAIKIAGAGLVFPFLALMFWRRATVKGIIAGVISGVLVTVCWEIADNPLGLHAVPGYISSLVVIVLISLVTRHSSSEEKKPLYSTINHKTDLAGESR
jgi:SSS family solute:Na+ symporter